MKTNRVAIRHASTPPAQPLKHPAPFPLQAVSHPPPAKGPTAVQVALDALKSWDISPETHSFGVWLAKRCRYATEDDRRRKVAVGEIFCYWTQKAIAAKRKRSVRQIKRFIRSLREAGMVVRRRPRRGASYIFLPAQALAASFQPKRAPQSVTGTGNYSSPGASSFQPEPFPANPQNSLGKTATDVPSPVPSPGPSPVPSPVPSYSESKILNVLDTKKETLRCEGNLKSISNLFRQHAPQVKVENPIPLDEGNSQVKVKIDPEILKQAQAQKARNESTRARLGIAGETTGRHKLNVDTQAVVV